MLPTVYKETFEWKRLYKYFFIISKDSIYYLITD